MKGSTDISGSSVNGLILFHSYTDWKGSIFKQGANKQIRNTENTMSEFLQPAELPYADAPAYTPLDSRYKKVLLLSATGYALVFFAAVAALLTGFAERISHWLIFFAVVASLALCLVVMYWVTLFYQSAGYGIRKKEVFYKSGVLFQSLIAIPFSRVQHCELESGPLDRKFGLASLTIYTAGGDGSDLTIPGLAEQEALQIKQFITSIADLDEEE